MVEAGWPRRRFLSMLAAGIAGGGAFLAGTHRRSSWQALCEEAVAADLLSSLVTRAPTARYWIAAGGPGTQCQSCHETGKVDLEAGARHAGTPVRCELCAHRCLIASGERGRCRARINVGGTLKTLVYGRPITTHVDPIEKKPFYHFLPGREAFSLATSGCPLRCQFCQNWQISQAKPEDYDADATSATAVVVSARARQSPVIAFTYNEPTVFIEYLTDIARAARPLGVRSVMVSCGYMNAAPLDELCDVLDAIKIDLKGFSPEFYRTISSAELSAVLRSIEQIHKRGRHLEIVNLVIPTLNDSDAMLDGLAKWIVSAIGRDVPVHFTRFHPDYQLQNLPPTPVATLERARGLALARGIRYAYVGNVPGHPGNHTYCPKCGKVVIERSGFFIQAMHMDHGRCSYCSETVAGVWS
jgi:pyruvate formate lyase activating enzyme